MGGQQEYGFVVVAESDGDYRWGATCLQQAGRDSWSRWSRMVITDGGQQEYACRLQAGIDYRGGIGW